MAVAGAPSRRFDIGRVVRRTFGVLGQNWIPFSLLTILLMVIPRLAWVVGLRLSGYVIPPGLAAYGSPWHWVKIVFDLITNAGLQATLIYAAMQSLSGRRPSLGESLMNGLRLSPAVFVILLGSNVATGFGLVLFIVPGVIIALALMVAAPVEVAEHTGIAQAFGRSADLTYHRRGMLLGLSCAYFVLAIIFILLLQTGLNLATLFQTPWMAWVRLAFAPLDEGLLEALIAVGVASIYYELRSLKDGLELGQLASAFD